MQILCIVSGLTTRFVESEAGGREHTATRSSVFVVWCLIQPYGLFYFVSSKYTPTTDVARNYSVKLQCFMFLVRWIRKFWFCATKKFRFYHSYFLLVRKSVCSVVLGVRGRVKPARNAATQKLAARNCTKYKTPLASINVVSTVERYLNGSWGNGWKNGGVKRRRCSRIHSMQLRWIWSKSCRVYIHKMVVLGKWIKINRQINKYVHE
jgi:hypothetical protein